MKTGVLVEKLNVFNRASLFIINISTCKSYRERDTDYIVLIIDV